MDKESEPVDRRGTLWDWPVPLMIASVLLLLVSASNSAPVGALLSLLLGGFALFAWLARRGSFSPRRD